MECRFTGSTVDFTITNNVVAVYKLSKRNLTIHSAISTGICLYLVIDKHEAKYVIEYYENDIYVSTAAEVQYTNEFIEQLFADIESIPYGATPTSETYDFIKHNSQLLWYKLLGLMDHTFHEDEYSDTWTDIEIHGVNPMRMTDALFNKIANTNLLNQSIYNQILQIVTSRPPSTTTKSARKN